MRGSSAGSLRPASRPRHAASARAVEPVRRDVGRIGLHARWPSSGSVARQPADLQRALEGHRAAEAELEAELDEGAGLLLAAVEGMRDAAAHRAARRCLSSAVGRRGARAASPAGRARAPARSCAAIEVLLALAVQARRRSGPGRSRRPPPAAGRRGAPASACAQRRQVVLAGARRCTADGCRARSAAMAMRQLAHRVEVAGVDRRQHASCATPAARARGDDGVAIGVELRRVEVAMGVDPHRPAMMHRPGTVTGHGQAVLPCRRLRPVVFVCRRLPDSRPMKQARRSTAVPAAPPRCRRRPRPRRRARGGRRRRARRAPAARPLLGRHERKRPVALAAARCWRSACWYGNPAPASDDSARADAGDRSTPPMRQSLENKPLLVAGDAAAYEAIIALGRARGRPR